jgi:hypothetical protein
MKRTANLHGGRTPTAQGFLISGLRRGGQSKLPMGSTKGGCRMSGGNAPLVKRICGNCPGTCGSEHRNSPNLDVWNQLLAERRKVGPLAGQPNPKVASNGVAPSKVAAGRVAHSRKFQ